MLAPFVADRGTRPAETPGERRSLVPARPGRAADLRAVVDRTVALPVRCCCCPAGTTCGARCRIPGCGGQMAADPDWPGYVRCERCRYVTIDCPNPPKF